MRKRNHLAKLHLRDFEEYCHAKGWKTESTKSFFEVLRMRHPEEKGVLLVHDRLAATVHYTTEGHSERLATSFYHKRKVPALDRVLLEI